jgi:hypothetical protein
MALSLLVNGLSLLSDILEASSIKYSGSITIMPSGDTDDYFTFSTSSNVPTLTATGATGFHLTPVVHVGNSVSLDSITYPSAIKYLSVANDETISDNNNRHGLAVTIQAAKTSAAYTALLCGGITQAYIGATNTQNFSNATYGLVGHANHIKIVAGATGTLTWGMGNQSFGEFAGMTTTNFASYYAIAPTKSGAGAATNVYQVYIEAPTIGTTLNYSIYSAGGTNYFAGHTAVGSTVPSTIYTFAVAETQSNPAEVKGAGKFTISPNATSGNNAQGIYGILGHVSIPATNNKNWTGTVADLGGINANIGYYYITSGATGTVTAAKCFSAYPYVDAMTTTSLYGLYISNATGAGTVTNQYGIYIEALTKGGTSNYALWNAGGDVVMAGANKLSFNGTLDSAAVTDQVSIGGYEISGGHRALALSSEEVVVTEVDETKFSHKLPVRINGATYNLMLCAT